MKRSSLLLATAALAAAAAVLAFTGTPADAGGAQKFKTRYSSGILPFEDQDELEILLTNTDKKARNAQIVVQAVGVNGQLDVIFDEPRELEARNFARATVPLSLVDPLRPYYFIEVLAAHPRVMVTSQLNRSGDPVDGHNLRNGDFLKEKGKFLGPIQ